MSRTLKRNVSYRPFEEGDVKFIWASGKITKSLAPNLTPATFYDDAVKYLYDRFDWAWTLLYDDRPIGVVVAVDNYTYKHINDIEWFAWATLRNKIEASLHFLSRVRKEHVLTVHQPKSELRFMEHLARYGMLSRVGTIHGADDEPLALFQTNNRVRKK